MVPSFNRQAFRLYWQLFTKVWVSSALRSHPHLGWLTGSAILLLAAISAPVAAQTVIVDEEFKDPTSFGWNVGISPNTSSIQPCLTAGTATTPATSIPACNPQQPINRPRAGALRLTTNDTNQATFAFYNYAIPASNGLVITFNFFSYGGTRQLYGSNADGITFFLFNGNTPNAQAKPGAFGGSLGYAQKLGTEPGLTNAYVGVGLDEFGNFANSNEGRGSGSPIPGNCDGYPNAAPDRVPDSVTIRGSGSGQAGYCYLTNSGSLVAQPDDPNGIDNPNIPTTGPREAALRTARIRLTPNYVLTVEIDSGNGFQTVIPPTPLNSFSDQGAPPPTFKFGFAAATGDATNIHEIRNLRIRTITNAPAPDLTLQKQPNTDTFIAGGTGEYTLTVKNVGQGPTYGPVTVTDTLPPGFSLASVTTPGWSCSENPAGKVTCIYSGDLRSTNPATDPVISPDESQSLVLRVNVPKTPDEYTNTAIVTTDADSNPTNNQAQAKVRVEPVGQPRLRLVKRITRVNETPYTDVVDDPTDANDDPGVWPVGLQPVGLANLSDQSPVQSGDEVEYTVYFLSDGAQTAQNIQICDPIPAQTTFDPNSFGSGTGIVLNQNQATTNLSNDSDTDAGTFFSPLTPVTAPCPDTNNPNGAVVVRVGDIPNTPPNNAGFVRFRVKID